MFPWLPRAASPVLPVCRQKPGCFQEWFWLESCSNKVHGRLPVCCNPTWTWPPRPAGYHPSPSPVSCRSRVHQPPHRRPAEPRRLKKTADPAVVQFTRLQLGAHSFARRRPTSDSMEGGGQWVWGSWCVSQQSAPLSTLAGGCMCLCSCACMWSSVAVFVASQDVEVTVSCGVVRRPALQHHHPKQTNKQDAV